MRSRLAVLSLTALSLLSGSPARADDAAQVAGRAKQVLVQHCLRCHGSEAPQGGFDFVTDLRRLVSSGLVVAGDTAGSLLYDRVSRGEMPPSGSARPSAAEIATLAAWITAGAPPE